MIDHDVLIQRSFELTPLSPTIVRLAELIGNPDADMVAIVKALSMDPPLTGQVLRLANSARFGGRTEVATAQDAVVRLGPSAILQLATRVGLRPTAERSLPQYGFAEGAFWKHSCAASFAVDALRGSVRGVVPAAAATAALLHDIGKLAMAQFLAPDCLESLWRARCESGLSPDQAEREILGVDHAEVGRLIAQHWRLPESIGDGIANHHDPERKECVLSDVVYLASSVADFAFPAANDLPAVRPSQLVLARLGLTQKHVDDAIDSVVAMLAAENMS